MLIARLDARTCKQFIMEPVRDSAIDIVRNTLTTKFSTLYGMFQDACEAFEMQNKFLNNEILELNQLRQDDLLRENHLIEWVYFLFLYV